MPAARRLKIGLSACFQHADPARPLFTGKTLQYVEQSIAHWIMSAGAMVVMVPCPTGETARGDVTLAHYADWLDGVVMHGGTDVWPGNYGEQPLRPEWNGDGVPEAIRLQSAPGRGYIAATQWHPEFHKRGSEALDDTAILQDFLAACEQAKAHPLTAHRPARIRDRAARMLRQALRPDRQKEKDKEKETGSTA